MPSNCRNKAKKIRNLLGFHFQVGARDPNSMENSQPAYFLKPAAMDRIFGQVFAALVRLGVGFKHSFVLEVRGRKSGRVFSTPVNLLRHNGRTYLCASRGETQWVRNARAAGRVTLVKGIEARGI